MIKKFLFYAVMMGLLVFLISGCSTAQIIDVGEADASVTLGQIDAEAGGIPGTGVKVELDGCTLIFRNIVKFLPEGTPPDKLLGSIVMKTPTCSFGSPTGTNSVLAPPATGTNGVLAPTSTNAGVRRGS